MAETNAFGHKHGQWQSMGAQLERLRQKGLVELRITDESQKQWRITKAGRAAAEMPNVAISERREGASQ